jgi:hypothetical protein
VARRLIPAMLSAAMLAAGGIAALGVPAAQSKASGGEKVTNKKRWDPDGKYLVRVTLDLRAKPSDKRGDNREYGELAAGKWVSITCQVRGRNGRLYDKVDVPGHQDFYVPDKYVRTYFVDEFITGVPKCT